MYTLVKKHLLLVIFLSRTIMIFNEDLIQKDLDPKVISAFPFIKDLIPLWNKICLVL